MRKIRDLIGDTQAQFGRRIGLSIHYIIAMENGERRVSDDVADLVLQATTIHPKWLQGKMGRRDQPINIVGVPITNPKDAQWALEEKVHPHKPITDDESRSIEDMCSDVRTFLEAATRKGRFLIARYKVRELMQKTANNLRFSNLMPAPKILKGGREKVSVRLTRNLIVPADAVVDPRLPPSKSERSSSRRRARV